MSNYPSSSVGALSSTGEAALSGYLAVSPVAASSGARSSLTVTGAADTGVTASTEQSDVYFNLARTVTWATGALTTQRFVRIAAPTIAFAGASTVTTAVTLDIAGAPVAGTNATITNAYALRVAGGAARFDGSLSLDATDASGTPGAATINKLAGKVAVAIGASSVTVTNSLVTTSSIVLASLQFVDATLTQILSVVPGLGSFTITGNANATAATKVAFVVIN